MWKNKLTFIFVLITFIFFYPLSFSFTWAKDYSPNVHWVFCIDSSGSMKAKGQKDLLQLITKKIDNEFINNKKHIIKPGDRITVFSFDEGVRLEATALYQTENDLALIRDSLVKINKRRGQLTFTSEAIVTALDFMKKYDHFFQTNALYVFTDGKSEPYSEKWSQKKIKNRKMKDQRNIKKITLSGKNKKTNVWLGVLKWAAFDDAQSFVKKMGTGARLVDLTDFNRLSLEKALRNFAQTVRSSVIFDGARDLDFGTIPYKTEQPYLKKITLSMQAESGNSPPPIRGKIKFEPDNPTKISQEQPVTIQTTENKMFLDLKLEQTNDLKPGVYKGRLEFTPSPAHFGALVINPSKMNVAFKKGGVVSFYFWKTLIGAGIALVLFVMLFNKVKRKMPIRV